MVNLAARQFWHARLSTHRIVHLYLNVSYVQVKKRLRSFNLQFR